MLIFDAHLDLSMNAMEWNRDLRQPLAELNAREQHLQDLPGRGRATVSLPELRKAKAGLVVATQIARYVTPDNPLPGWHSPEQAWAHSQGQLAWYRSMEKAGELVQITDFKRLEKQLALWQDESIDNASKPIGYILSLEGADSLVDIDYLHKAYDYGLRALGPAHYGPGRYAYGTHVEGPLGAPGRQLLREMEKLNIILDVSHLCDQSFWEAMDHFNGNMWASHSNCRSLAPDQRQFDDRQIGELIQRKAVIGVVLDAWMMVPGWIRGQSTPKSTGCKLETIIDHIDHICQLAGNTLHVGIGSDLDGGFGQEQCPYDLESIADLQKLPGLLSKRGYSNLDIEGIMHGNWVGFLKRTWDS